MKTCFQTRNSEKVLTYKSGENHAGLLRHGAHDSEHCDTGVLQLGLAHPVKIYDDKMKMMLFKAKIIYSSLQKIGMMAFDGDTCPF